MRQLFLCETVDRIVDLCQRDLAFIWLTKGQKPQRDVFYDFKGKKLTGEVLDELNYQKHVGRTITVKLFSLFILNLDTKTLHNNVKLCLLLNTDIVLNSRLNY